MRYYRNGGGDKILAIFTRGDLLLEGLIEIAEREGFDVAAITGGIGSLDRCTFYYITGTTIPIPKEYVTLEGPIEVASIQGTIIEGQPHVHLTISDLNRVYTGHLEPGSRVLFRVEVSLQVLEGVRLTSKRNDETGMVDIVPKV